MYTNVAEERIFNDDIFQERYERYKKELEKARLEAQEEHKSVVLVYDYEGQLDKIVAMNDEEIKAIKEICDRYDEDSMDVKNPEPSNPWSYNIIENYSSSLQDIMGDNTIEDYVRYYLIKNNEARLAALLVLEAPEVLIGSCGSYIQELYSGVVEYIGSIELVDNSFKEVKEASCTIYDEEYCPSEGQYLIFDNEIAVYPTTDCGKVCITKVGTVCTGRLLM